MAQNDIDKVIARIVATFEGKILVLKRSKDAPNRAGLWELPGGHVEGGETLEQTVERELSEEAGVVVQNTRYLLSQSYTLDKGVHRLGVIFEGEATSGQVGLSFEHEAYAWIDRSNFNNIDIYSEHKKVIDAVLPKEEEMIDVQNNDDKNTTKIDHVIAFTDGGSRGNPGPSATGYVIMDSDKQILIEGGEYLGITTNNQAEYQAVLTALEECKKLAARTVDFYIDSLLVVNQMNGSYKVKNRDLWPIHEKIKQLANDFEEVTFTHVRREKNKLADAKVNEVLDNYQK